MEEQKRIAVASKYFRKEVKIKDATLLLGISERQTYRIIARIKKEGAKGAIHGNQGKSCSWKIPDEVEGKIAKLYKSKYLGFNDTHFREKLIEEEGFNEISREKIRQILRENKIEAARKRRPPRYRSRRDRKEMEGMMLQVDGSYDDWLEGRGPHLCLIGGIDDAMNNVPACTFDDKERTAGYFRIFHQIFNKKGLPLSVYSDKHMIFHSPREATIEEQLNNKMPTTQLGRAMKELGITLIPASSPQAKGRIERLWNTFQDRLKSELRLAKARTKEEAQAVLDKFLPEFNKKFSRKAKKDGSAYRSVPKNLDLKYILCFRYKRIVANDNTISLNGKALQIPKIHPRISFAQKRVDVIILPDGKVEILFKHKRIAQFENIKFQLEEAA